jgi:hypothetical protein
MVTRAQIKEGACHILALCRDDRGRPMGPEALDLHWQDCGVVGDVEAYWPAVVAVARKTEPALRDHPEGVYLP